MPAQRPAYTTDGRAEAWQILAPLLPPEKPGGRPRQDPRREVVNGIQDGRRGGCAWRLMPHDLPPGPTAYQTFRAWRQDGTWRRRHDQRRDRVRTAMGRQPRGPGREDHGNRGPPGADGAKKIRGRPRPLRVETPGLLRRGLVHAADLRAAATAPWRLAAALATDTPLPRLWADLASRRPARRLGLATDWGGWRSSNGPDAGAAILWLSHRRRCRR